MVDCGALNRVRKYCESPIEEAMLDAIVETAQSRGTHLIVAQNQGRAEIVVQAGKRAPIFVLKCQYQPMVLPFRFDFLLADWDGDDALVVECDGHNFHERTRVQAARDRYRDRRVQHWGADVFRFTGSEIHHDALACAFECFTHLELK